MSEPNEVDALAAAQEKEYGTYVAVAPIDIDGVRAFNPGHPVPVSHVEKFKDLFEGLVAKVEDVAAGTAPATTTTTTNQPAPQGDPVVIDGKV